MKTTTPPDQDSADALTEALHDFISKQQATYQRLYDQMDAAGNDEKAQFSRGFCHGFGEIIGELYRLKRERHPERADDAEGVEDG